MTQDFRVASEVTETRGIHVILSLFGNCSESFILQNPASTGKNTLRYNSSDLTSDN
jgi:hypothetical protein